MWAARHDEGPRRVGVLGLPLTDTLTYPAAPPTAPRVIRHASCLLGSRFHGASLGHAAPSSASFSSAHPSAAPRAFPPLLRTSIVTAHPKFLLFLCLGYEASMRGSPNPTNTFT